MTAEIIDGKAISAAVREDVAKDVEKLKAKGITPKLAAILVDFFPPSKIYVDAKEKACANVGMLSERVDLPADVSREDYFAEIKRLNEDPTVHGIIAQLPVPEHLNPEIEIQLAIDPAKDVDCLHPLNLGLMARGEGMFFPATPFGIVEMLDRSGVDPKGKHVVVVGRGGLVGLPLSVMLVQKKPRANATVTVCHTGTQDIPKYTREADILIAAAGRPGTVTADMVKPGAVVIDVAVNRLDSGKLVGDVEFDAVKEVAGAISPVPGGVGPMTVAMLIKNTLTAAQAQAE
jgi:methylenetetrahydrofolate dehydrogenase (NADP+) / methenyltetrahydrofolate cyclohydrolase